MTLENINFTINNILILIFLLIIGFGYTYFIYRFTIPRTSKFIRILLILLRSFALGLIILFLFEPSITLNFLKRDEPINLLLIDNSSSIVNKDSLNRSNNVNKFISDYKNNIKGNIKIASFGKDVKLMDSENELALNFSESLTNFENIPTFIKEQKGNIASVTIVSDGIITDGTNSTTEIEKLNIPIFTIGVGDTTRQSDIGINKVEFNKLIYLNSRTEINGIISNLNFANKNVMVSLLDKAGLVEQKQIKLNDSGINNISFYYEAKEVGKQSLTITISQLDSEITYENNKYPFVIEVLDDKTNVLIIAGAPSSDLSFVNQSLAKNENIRLNKIIQITNNKFLDNVDYASKIDSAKVIIMIDFPSKETPQNLFQSVINNLKSKNTPYFLVLSELTDYTKLNIFKDILPFVIKSISKDYQLVQPEIISDGSGIISNSSQWESLAPIRIGNKQIEVKDKSSIIATGKIKNEQVEVPLIFAQKVASSRRIVLNGFDFWKWELQSDRKIENLFDLFLNNSLKWLSTKKEELIFITTSKNIFNSNESIEFIGNVYDETLQPINDALVEVEISSDGYRNNLKLQSDNNGIYSGNINISKSGSFNYKGTITIKDESPKFVKGQFIISDIKIENINFVLNSNYLTFISNTSSGKSFNIANYSDLFAKIEQLSRIQTNDEIIFTKYELWYNKWILLIVILFFAFEWIVRKQKGML